MGLGIVFCVFLAFFKSKDIKDLNGLNGIPLNELPLEEIQGSPNNYLVRCVLREVIVQEIALNGLNGELFGLCDYRVKDQVQTLAVLLGYVNTNKRTTFVFGKQMGLFDLPFETNAFQNVAKTAGYTPGTKLFVILTPIGRPINGQGLYNTNFIGDDIDSLYTNKLSDFVSFSKSANAEVLPAQKKIQGAPIVLPVSADVVN